MNAIDIYRVHCLNAEPTRRQDNLSAAVCVLMGVLLSSLLWAAIVWWVLG